MVIAIVLVAAVAVVAVVVRELRRSKQTRPLRDEQAEQPVLFQTPVHIKRDSAPKWALGAAGFRLVVRPGTISVLGPGESQSWYFSGSESSVEWVHEGSKDWIVVAGTNPGHQSRVWVLPIDRNRLWEAWSALVSENATPLTEPPLPG